MNSDLYLKQLELGPMQNFVYLVGSKSAKTCYVVDPAWEIDTILNVAAKDEIKIIGGIVTHYHPDHVGGHLWGYDIEGCLELVGKANIPIYANEHEFEGLKKITGLEKSDIKLCKSGDVLTLGSAQIKLIHTPGHTPGSQCILVNDCLVSGDTLFITGCGRVDLPGGDADQMYDSLTNKLAKLPDKTVLYPGHHYDEEGFTSMQKVKAKNPYLQTANKEAWRTLRGV